MRLFPNKLKANTCFGFVRLGLRGKLTLMCLFSLLLVACSELEKPKTEEFYSESKPPRKQEFRWSNGKQPKTFDPAFVSAPPETDIARAIYDGLTETDSKSLKALPAIASEWESSEDHKIWTFKLRKDSRWSNGKVVVAQDFERSWKRLSELGEKVPSHELLKNIVGVEHDHEKHASKDTDVDVFSKHEARKITAKKGVERQTADEKSNFQSPLENSNSSNENSEVVIKPKASLKKLESQKKNAAKTAKFGVVAIDERTLRVTLKQSDREFPKLVAHPVFRPVYAIGEEFEDSKLKADIVTNGAFQIVSVNEKGVTLEKAETYWNKEKVKLERVIFVPAKDADSALKAYRDGDVDAVTNVDFEPLALKLLTPYFDFRRTTHSALNFYEFNRQKAPFNDRRVRKALAISIERERLTEDKMDGATKPAYNFLPFNEPEGDSKLTKNSAEAKDLMEKAGFPNGENFPQIKLVVNRNNVQKQIAKSVAEMWKKELNIDTEIIIKEAGELEAAKAKQDYDVVRRGVVFPTADETANMLSIFKPTQSGKDSQITSGKSGSDGAGSRKGKLTIPMYGNSNSNSNQGTNSDSVGDGSNELIVEIGERDYILTEQEAMSEVPAIPLYFPTSYSLVKPYVNGFEMNALDAPSLKEVNIDSDWQPKNPKSGS